MVSKTELNYVWKLLNIVFILNIRYSDINADASFILKINIKNYKLNYYSLISFWFHPDFFGIEIIPMLWKFLILHSNIKPEA